MERIIHRERFTFLELNGTAYQKARYILELGKLNDTWQIEFRMKYFQV